MDVHLADPCNCPEGMGYSSSEGMCMEGSTTMCYECPSMEECVEGTCADFECVADFMEMYTCQCNYECDEYGNCCEDYMECPVHNFSYDHPLIEGLHGFTATELFTTGEVVKTSEGEYYRPPGVLDGLGATRLDENTVRVYSNHEIKP